MEKVFPRQLQHKGMIYCYQTWYTASLFEDNVWDCFWILGIKVRVHYIKIKKGFRTITNESNEILQSIFVYKKLS
jgi:hypothetical protein